jgi:hypothetical protein
MTAGGASSATTAQAGLPASTHCALRVRAAGSGQPWLPAFAWPTSCLDRE